MTIDNSLKRQGIDILKKEQNSLDGAFDRQAKEKAPVDNNIETITQKSDGTWTRTTIRGKKIYDEDVVPQKEKEFKDDAEVLQDLCKRVDDKIIAFNNQINIKKQQIVDLSVTASKGNCSPGIAYSGSQGSSTPVGAAQTSLVTNTTIKNDIERVKTYVPMAGPGYNPGAENPFDPDSILSLSPSNSGFGYKNLVDPVQFKNNSNVATGSSVDGSGSIIGNGRFDVSTTLGDHSGPTLVSTVGLQTGFWYAGAGVAPYATLTTVTAAQCVGIANSITAIYDEIIALRIERDSLRGSLNGVKKKKMEKELGHWGYQNMKTEVSRRKVQNSAAISAIEKLDTKEEVVVEEGLQTHLDAANNASYYGAGDIWFDISERGDSDADIQPNASTGPQFIEALTSEGNYFSLDGDNDRVNFDAGNIDANTPQVTVEMLARLNVDLFPADQASQTPGVGIQMMMGWEKYNVCIGESVSVGSTANVYGLGFNSGRGGFNQNDLGDIYGIDGDRFASLALNNNWKHYVFEFNKDDYTNNKIYIDGVEQTGLKQVRVEPLTFWVGGSNIGAWDNGEVSGKIGDKWTLSNSDRTATLGGTSGFVGSNLWSGVMSRGNTYRFTLDVVNGDSEGGWAFVTNQVDTNDHPDSLGGNTLGLRGGHNSMGCYGDMATANSRSDGQNQIASSHSVSPNGTKKIHFVVYRPTVGVSKVWVRGDFDGHWVGPINNYGTPYNIDSNPSFFLADIDLIYFKLIGHTANNTSFTLIDQDIIGQPETANLTFNNGQGRIAGWRENNLYRSKMDISMMRVYNKVLTAQEISENFDEVRDRFVD